MSKVLVRKAIEPVVNIGSSGPELAFQQTLGRNSTDKKLPDRGPLDRKTPLDASTARHQAREAEAALAQDYSMSPQEYFLANQNRPATEVDMDEYTRGRLQAQRRAKEGQPRSYAERYGADAYDRFTNSQKTYNQPISHEVRERANLRGARAADVGVRGRQFGRGVAGALAGLSFLGGLESAGAAGAGLEQGIGGGALRAQATYGQAAPMLTNIGGEAGARLGAGSVGVRERVDEARAAQAARAAARQPVAVAAPTVEPPTQQRSQMTSPYSDYSVEQLESILSHNMPGALPTHEAALVGARRRASPTTANRPFDMRGGAYNADVFEPVPQFNPASQAPGAPAGQTNLTSLIGIQPAQPNVAEPMTAAPIPTTATGMAAAFQPQQQGSEPAPPAGGVKATQEQAKRLQEGFMGGMNGGE